MEILYKMEDSRYFAEDYRFLDENNKYVMEAGDRCKNRIK